LKKRKDTWLKFGSCIKKPWMSSAERRENKPVWPSASVGGRAGVVRSFETVPPFPRANS
jgi:hypothetical protein